MPQPDRVIKTATHQCLAVGTDGEGNGIAGMTCEGGSEVSLQVPTV